MAEDRSVLSRPAPPPDSVLRYGDHPDQVVDLWAGDDRAAGRPLVVLVHGGFWRPEYDRTHLRPLAAGIHDAGWSVASIEYRREPGRPDVTVDDVRTALAWLPREAVDHDGTKLLVGHSAGGHLVLWAAASSELQGVVALAPVADLVLAEKLHLDEGAVADFLGGAAETRPDLDPVRLDKPDTPVTVIHGKEDTVVPIELAEAYAAAHPSSRLVVVPGAGHFELIDPLSPVWPLVAAELSRCAR
jgi:acetyl esterase/lipase